MKKRIEKGQRDGPKVPADDNKLQESRGGTLTENGQTVCANHNFRKKYLRQMETGKKLFIRFHELSKSDGDRETEIFCRHILEVFEEYEVDDRVEWKR